MRIFLIAALGAVFSCPAFAQSLCADRSQLVAELAREFGERQLGVGLVHKGVIVELMVSEQDKTWTLVATAANGVSCIVAAGDHWQTTPPKAPGTRSGLHL